jgi:hypothetical protein
MEQILRRIFLFVSKLSDLSMLARPWVESGFFDLED